MPPLPKLLTLNNACLKNPSQLPIRHLDKLVLFYNFVGKIDYKIYAFREEQERLERIVSQPNTDANQCASITHALRRLANTSAEMCDELVKCQPVEKLRDLPTNYEDIYRFPPDFK